MKLIDEIKRHSADSKLALLLRHGDREEIPQGEFGNEILLNEKGKHKSMAFGIALRQFSVRRIFTSPIPRCVQTAELIAKGVGIELEITQTISLGDPGLHITDEKVAGNFYLTHGFHKILRRFMRNESVPGVPDKHHFTKIMTEFLHKNTTNDGLTAFITHDSLIAMFHYCIDEKVYHPYQLDICNGKLSMIY